MNGSRRALVPSRGLGSSASWRSRQTWITRKRRCIGASVVKHEWVVPLARVAAAPACYTALASPPLHNEGAVKDRVLDLDRLRVLVRPLPRFVVAAARRTMTVSGGGPIGSFETGFVHHLVGWTWPNQRPLSTTTTTTTTTHTHTDHHDHTRANTQTTMTTHAHTHRGGGITPPLSTGTLATTHRLTPSTKIWFDLLSVNTVHVTSFPRAQAFGSFGATPQVHAANAKRVKRKGIGHRGKPRERAQSIDVKVRLPCGGRAQGAVPS